MRKVVLFPVRLLLGIINLLVAIVLKLESLIGGIFFLFLTVCIVLAVFNKMWLQTGIFLGIFGICVVILLLSAHIKASIEILLEKL